VIAFALPVVLVTSQPASANSPPTHETPLVTSECGTDTTNEDLTVTPQNVNDVDGDDVKNIINWSKNGTSIAVLNMPFASDNSAGDGKTKDYSGYGYNLTENGASWTANGGFDGNGFYEFSGSNQYLTLGSDVADLDMGTGDFTISMWLKPATDSTRLMALSKMEYSPGLSGYFIDYDTDRRFRFNTQTAGTVYSNIKSAGTYAPNVWYHVVGVRNSTGTAGVHIYINGILDDGTTYTGAGGEADNIDSNANLEIGAINQRPTPLWWNGAIDQVQIYKHALTPEQIEALNNNRTDLIVSQETSVGDTWSACITPNDGTVDGNKLCSNELTIQPASANSPPTHTTPVLTSESGTDTTDEDLTVTPQNVSDADCDVVNNIINWSKNGTSITLLNMPFEKVDGTDSNNAKDYGNGHTGTVSGATWSATAGHEEMAILELSAVLHGVLQQAMMEKEHIPLMDRMITSTLEPGSITKNSQYQCGSTQALRKCNGQI
jgi:hypothetical protein